MANKAGEKTGGRQKGVPNKDTKAIADLLAEKYPNYHPVIALVDIAINQKNDIGIRVMANKEVAKYVCPQLKSMDIKSNGEGVKTFILNLSEVTTKADGSLSKGA